MSWSDASCKVYNLTYEFTKQMNVWLMVAVSIEMAVAARWPKRTHVMCTRERATNVVLLLTILLVCLNIHFFWTWSVKRRSFCQYTDEFSDGFRSTYWPVILILTEVMLPLILVSVFFYCTVSALVQRKDQEEESMKAEMSKYFLELNGLFELRNVCLILCLFFLCITTFDGTLHFASLVYSLSDKLECYDEGRYNIMRKLLSTLNWTFKAVFYSGKVLLYLTMSPAFKKRLMDKLQAIGGRFKSCYERSCCSRWCPRRRREWSPVPSASTSGDCLGALDNGGTERGGRGRMQVTDNELVSTHV